MNTEEFLKYPARDGWPLQFLGAWLVGLLSMLLIGQILIYGFALKVLREDSMPTFRPLTGLILDGLKSSIVFIGYMAPGFALIWLGSDLLGSIGLLLVLLAAYTFYSGIYSLANNGLKAAFTPRVVRRAFTFDYLTALLAMIGVQLGLGLAYTFSLLLILPVLLYPAAIFYINVYAVRAFKVKLES